MSGKEWFNWLTFSVGVVIVGIITLYVALEGDLALLNIFGERYQRARYNMRQASPEVIEGKKQIITQAFKDYCDPSKTGFQIAAKNQILEAAAELDDLSVLPVYQQELVTKIRQGTYKCSNVNTLEIQ